MRSWIWPNRYRGEVVGEINGRRHVMRLSLSALAQIEACYGDTDIVQLSQRFAADGMAEQDAENIIRAGLAACGDVTAYQLPPLYVKGGAAQKQDMAHQLLAAAFTDWTQD